MRADVLTIVGCQYLPPYGSSEFNDLAKLAEHELDRARGRTDALWLISCGYLYGVTQGIRQERQRRKKRLSIELKHS